MNKDIKQETATGKAQQEQEQQENKISCYECSDLFKESKMKVCEDMNYCLKCYEEVVYGCECCNYRMHRDNTYNFEGTIYCEDCYHDKTFSCENCCEVYSQDDAYNCNDGMYCGDCYEDEDHSDLREVVIPFTKELSETYNKNKFKQFCGVEIETFNDNIEENQFNYNDLCNYGFNQGQDGSLSGNGMEFSSNAFNGDLLFNKIDKFTNELNKKEYFINAQCGLHIHIGVGNINYRTLKKILYFYSKYEDLFFSMLPSSRQNNQYCRKIEQEYDLSQEKILELKSLKEICYLVYETKRNNNIKRRRKEKYGGKRYGWLNLHSLLYRGTIEIRNHNGTINKDKIKHWLNIHLTAINFIRKNSLETLKNMNKTSLDFLNIFPKETQTYIKDRWVKFNVELEEQRDKEREFKRMIEGERN